jgi:uncharacterized protein YidB (DUF937 family)
VQVGLDLVDRDHLSECRKEKMSLLDLAGQLLGGGQQLGQPSSENLLSEVIGMVNNHPGGLTGLIQSFQHGGLGEAASSWIGTGQNLPVSSDQIQRVLGDERVQALAAKLGISPEDAGSHLAQLLPSVIDHLTPNGQMPSEESGGLLDLGAKLLRGFAT